MAVKSAIEWTGSTRNPVTGCTKASPGCMNCYAERMAKRLQAMEEEGARQILFTKKGIRGQVPAFFIFQVKAHPMAS